MNDRWYVVFICYAKLSSRVLRSLSKITTFWKPKRSRFLGQKPEILLGKNVCHYGIAHIQWRIVLGSPKSRDAWVVFGWKNVWNNRYFKPSNVKARPVRPFWGQIRRTSISADLIKNWPGIRWKLDLTNISQWKLEGEASLFLGTCGMVLSIEIPQLNQTTLQCSSCVFFHVPLLRAYSNSYRGLPSRKLKW